MHETDDSTAYFSWGHKLRVKNAYKIDLRCEFNKHLTNVTYGHFKKSLPILKTLHGTMHAMESLAYLSSAVSYGCKMFVKLTTGPEV